MFTSSCCLLQTTSSCSSAVKPKVHQAEDSVGQNQAVIGWSRSATRTRTNIKEVILTFWSGPARVLT
ncbi:hypothetical protein CHARACLAT_032014 [Characodon lateralis]|uniref:Secreted protein n=1 Tax=Characodon lateralis TaxID=208331 RepID=A0ABU7DCB4_9TELE|nr:hypothetical protein [Characodon lateralis]